MCENQLHYNFSFELNESRYLFALTSKGWQIQKVNCGKSGEGYFLDDMIEHNLQNQYLVKLKKTLSNAWEILNNNLINESEIAQSILNLENEIKESQQQNWRE